MFFNGLLWHGDSDKAAEYHNATPLMQAYILKCPEIRTFYAVPFVRALHDWVIAKRNAGYDLQAALGLRRRGQ